MAVVTDGRAGALLDGGLAGAMHQAFVSTGLDPVFVPPGAGTVACAALAMAGRERPLAILPCGTMNLLAKDLGLPSPPPPPLLPSGRAAFAPST